MSIINRIQQELNEMRDQGLERKLYPNLDQHLNFTSNDYLGLSRHPELAQAFQEGIQREGVGSVGSRLLGGDREAFHQLEASWAKWKSQESALYYNSGFNANISIPQALFSRETHVFCDKLNHASLYDGLKLSPAQLHRYAHNDLEHLESLLIKYPGEGVIITESVFSMDGDQAPLIEIAQLAQKYQCLLMVDEAHSDGIYGPEGKGLVHQLGLENQVDLIISTLGKSYACAGALISGRRVLIQMLTQKSRGLTYTTAQVPALCYAIQKAIELSIEEPQRREDLLHNAQYFRTGLEQLELETIASDSQIVPIILSENEKALRWAQALQDQGFWIQAIRPPTVPRGSARLRVNLNASHTQEQLDQLLEALKTLQKVSP